MDCRSAVGVANGSIIIREYGIIISQGEALQLIRARQEGNKLYASLLLKLGKTSNHMKNIITQKGFINVLEKYYLHIYRCRLNAVSSNNSRLYSLITDPHFLLYAYELLQNQKVFESLDVTPTGNITLLRIVNLAKELRTQTYRPSPSK